MNRHKEGKKLICMAKDSDGTVCGRKGKYLVTIMGNFKMGN